MHHVLDINLQLIVLDNKCVLGLSTKLSITKTYYQVVVSKCPTNTTVSDLILHGFSFPFNLTLQFSVISKNIMFMFLFLEVYLI